MTPLARNTGNFLICAKIKSAHLKDRILAKSPLHPVPIPVIKGKFQIRCLCCHSDFFTSKRLSKYCSKKCKASYQAKTRFWKYETKECPNCYHKFESRRDSNTRTCGARCGQAMVQNRTFGGAKLTLEQVNQIRSEHPQKTMYRLAKEYGVCDRTISDIVKKKRWN